MNNRRLKSLVLLMVCMFAALARAEWQVADVLTEGSGKEYWVCIVREDQSVHDKEKPATSSLRQRVDPVAGKWTEVGGLQSRVIDIAAIGSDIAVLTSNGDWKRFYKGGGAGEGQGLPAPYRALSFGGDGNTLYAIAAPVQRSTPATTTTSKPSVEVLPAVFQWNGSWTRVADLPAGAVAAETAVSASAGKVYLASHQGTDIVVDRLEGDAWKRVTHISAAGVAKFKLLPNDKQLCIGSRDAAGAWSVWSIGDENSTPPKPLDAHLPSDVTFVSKTLRLVYLDGDKFTQISIDNYGHGNRYEPTEIAAVPQGQRAVNNWLSVAVLVMLTVTMLITLRQRPGMPVEIPDAMRIRLAPLGRRIAAGVIDITPVIAAMAYSAHSNEGTTADIQQVLGRAWLVYGAFLIYVVHTTIGEALYGRSIGKYLFGLRVVSYNGDRVPAGRIVLRNLMRMLDATLIYVPLFLLIFTPLRQRVGDLAARTIVIVDEVPEEDPSDPSAD